MCKCRTKKPGEETYAHIDRAEPDPLMDDNSFHAELSGAEVDDALNWAGLDGRLIKERDAWDIEEDALHTEPRPISHHAPRAPVFDDTLVLLLGAPDKEDERL